ncbi:MULTISPECIES: glycosyltransferase [Planktothrix]
MSMISIIIPVYNAEKTIQSTINSVLNQTFIDWELIVINDGSTEFFYRNNKLKLSSINMVFLKILV